MDKSKFNNKQEWRKFAIGLSAILTVISFIQWYINSDEYLYVLLVGIAVLLIGLTAPIIIKPFYIVFSYLGVILNWIMTRIILIILFYLIFTPIGVTMRLFGKMLLDTRLNKSKNSYWVDRENAPNLNDNYKTQF